MNEMSQVALIEATTPGKFLYGILGVSSMVMFSVTILEMYTMGLALLPAIVSVLSLALLVYCGYKFYKVWKAESAYNELQEKIAANVLEQAVA